MADYTYKLETSTLRRMFGLPPQQISQFIIRDAEGKHYSSAPADWSEEDVAAAVAHLNANAEGARALRAELGEEGYARYLDDNSEG